MEKATFAAGCFWGVEAAFRQVKGVVATAVGYTGGTLKNPTYQDVCTDKTGHAEAVQVEYDPAQGSYADLLNVFWENHDPTQLNRQGPDRGTQYRSTIFPANPLQAEIAKAYIAQLDQAHAFSAAIVTTIEPGRQFYPAEAYHQDFLTRHPGSPYIVAYDLPKLEELRRIFPELYRADPVLVAAGSLSN
jgi:peptide-methionine (S)-S-oxide reductase